MSPFSIINTSMLDLRACLACLSTKHKLKKLTEANQKLYLSLLGIKIDDIDGYPTYFCFICQAQIRKILAFKRKCRRAYYVLKEIASVKEKITLNEIMKVNRKKTNLVSSMSIGKTSNTGVYFTEPVQRDTDTLVDYWGKCDPKDEGLKLVKQEFNSKGSILYIDIKSSVAIEQESEIETKKEVSKIENINEPSNGVTNESLEKTTNHLPENVISDFPQDINDDDDDDAGLMSESEENPTLRKKRRYKREVLEFKSKILKMPVNRVAAALANANIRCLTKVEQITMYKKAKDCAFLLARFKCAMCVTVYDSVRSLMEHTSYHRKLSYSNHICDICKTKFFEEQDLTIHIAEKHAYQFTCKLCENSSFNFLDKYISHYELNHEEGKYPANRKKEYKEIVEKYFTAHPVDPYTMHAKLADPSCKYECPECRMRFIEDRCYHKHMRQHNLKEPTRRPCICDICNLPYKNTYELSIHMDKWHLFIYECKKCNEVAYNSYEALYHRRTKHEIAIKYDCQYCGKLWKTEGALNVHLQKEHYSVTYRNHCALCGDSFRYPLALYRHQLIVHKYISVVDPALVDDGHICNICEAAFLSLKSYQTHAMKHNHEVAKTFENACHLCNIIFDSTKEYQYHLLSKCKSLVRYPRKCPFCDLMMTNYVTYRAHHKKKHGSMSLQMLRGYVLCEVCGVTVSNAAGHAHGHVERVAFECEHCSPKVYFPNMWKYSIHVLTVHTSKPFICSFCSQSFALRKTCKAHMFENHPVATPYKCETCRDEFYNVKNLTQHCMTYGHTHLAQNYNINSKKKLYVYPHMKINVTMFNPKLLSKLRLYLFDFMKKDWILLSDINNYIYFENQDKLPPVVLEKRPKRNVTYLEEEGMVNDLIANGSKFESIQNDAKFSKDMILPMMPQKKRKKPIYETVEESGVEYDFNEIDFESIPDSCTLKLNEMPPEMSGEKSKENKPQVTDETRIVYVLNRPRFNEINVKLSTVSRDDVLGGV